MKDKIILKGVPASPGCVEGRVRIIASAKELKGLKKGDIVVTSFLTPDLISEIKKNPGLTGVITDKGGITCHAAVVAREMKLPYIAGAVKATKKLKSNSVVGMDGGKGIIYENC